MPTIPFAEFQAEAVASGRKRRTIRPPRKTPIEPGQRLRLTGPRRSPRLLLEADCISTAAVDLEISPTGALVSVAVDGLRIADADAFAVEDGFADAATMGAFFHNLRGPGVFRGVMICW